MTTEEKLKIRRELANILTRYGAIKGELENNAGILNTPQEEFKNEIESLNQVWDQIFIIWDKLEQAMALDAVPYNQMEPAINESTTIFNDTLNKIEKSIKTREGDNGY